MKYWLITTEFPPIHGGGISTYCWQTAKMLSLQGHSVTVFINDSSVINLKEEQLETNLKIVRFKPNQVAQAQVLGYEAGLSMEFAQVVENQMKKDGVPDVLETQDYLGIGYYTLQKKYLLYPFFKDLKIVVTVHAPSFLYLEYNQVPHYKFPEYWTGEMEKACMLMADVLLSPSNYIVEKLSSRFTIKANKPIRVFNPYEFEQKEISASTDDGEIVFFGKLTPQKGCLEMLHYLSKMWDKGFKQAITVVGGGSHLFYPFGEDMIEYLQKKYDKYIKQNLIKFEGNLEPKILKHKLKSAKVIIAPSIVDNLPYAIIEAMALGKTVLCSTDGGHTELIQEGKNGFLFDHQYEDSFEKALNHILSLSADQLLQIGLNAQEAIRIHCNYASVYAEKIELIRASHTKSSRRVFPFIEPIEQVIPSKDIECEKGLLSIVIPFYNLGPYIEETVESLQKISYDLTEILIVDDGSTDEHSIKTLERIEKHYPVQVLRKDNTGLSDTRNFGALKSRGDFLAFLDADDLVSSNYYEKSIQILKHYSNISFVGCWAQYFGESAQVWPTFNPEPPYLLTHNMINSSALIYKRSDFINFGMNDPKMIYGMEDYDSVISMVKQGARGVSIPELWWQYRIRKDSMAQSFTKNKELFLYRLMTEKHQKFMETYSSEIINLLNHNGPGIYFNNPTKKLDISNRLNQKLLMMIKKSPIIRKFAKKVFRILNN